MSKGISSFVGKNVVVRLRDQRTEEITGTIVSIDDKRGYKIKYESRGSTYTYYIPFTVPVYSKTELNKTAKFEKGEEITAEISINRIVKVKGEVIGADESGIILSYVSRNKNTQDYFAFAQLERIQFAELTKEGMKAAKEKSARMKEARGDKKSKKSKGGKSSDKKSKKSKIKIRRK